MKALDRKVLRDLGSMRGQMLAIALVIVGGVATYVCMQSVKHALEDSLDVYYRDYRFADGFASVRRAPLSLAQRLVAVPGIQALEARVSAPATLEIAGFDEPVSGQIVSIPEGVEPALNQLCLRKGRLVRAGHEDEVVLNEAFANAHRLGPGDQLGAIIKGHRKRLRVVGVALSPEFLMQLQPGSLFPDPTRYGVLWMGRDALAAAFEMEEAFNDLAFTVSPGADVSEVIRRLDLLLAPYGGPGALPRRDQASNFFIHEEFRQLTSSATTLPIVFLCVAAFLLNVVVGRLISLQREQIGILKAFGHSNLDVGVHYLKLVLVVGLVGVAGGSALGLWLGRLMGGLYLEYYRFPALYFGTSGHAVIEGAFLTLGAAVLGVLQAVRRAVRLPPAVAMRPPSPPLYRATVFERLGLQGAFDEPTRMIARSLERRPLRALLTATGMASSCAILIMGIFFVDSFEYVLRVQYGLAQRENLTASFVEPTSLRAVYEVAALPGVVHAEPFRSVPVRLRHEHRRYDTTIEGVPPRPHLHRLIDKDLQLVTAPRHGIVITERLAQILDVREGDEITVDVREGSRRTRLETVAGLTRQFIGIAAYMDLEALNRFAGNGQAVSGVYLMTDARREEDLTRALQRRPRVGAIVSQERAIAAFQESYDRSVLTMTFILSLFAGVIAFGVIYNSARIALSERDRELASLRVLGRTRGEVAYILLGELALLTLIAIPVGLGLGSLAAAGLARSLETDLYQFPFIIGRRTLGLAAAIVLLSAVLSALIVRFRLARLDLIGVLKTRE
jgi:putative ABC transport system permease protein